MNTLLDANEALNIIQAHYALPDIEYCMFIRRGFNDTYVIEAAQQQYIFRLYLDQKYYISSSQDFEFELDLLQHLHARKIPVAHALPQANGSLLGSASTNHGQRAFALFSYADGIQLSAAAVTVEQARELGYVMAAMHMAADEFKTEHSRYKLDTRYLIDEPLRLIEQGANTDAEPNQDVKIGQQIIEKLQPIQKYIDRISSIGTDNGRFGIIHADLHPGNIHFRGNELTIFDFDHCAYGWRAYDLAIAYAYPVALRDAMILGYESVRPLSAEERDSLQDLANLRNLWDIGDVLATRKLRDIPA